MSTPINKTFLNLEGASSPQELSLKRLVPSTRSPFLWALNARRRLLELEVAMATRWMILLYLPQGPLWSKTQLQLANNAMERVHLRSGLSGLEGEAHAWATRIDSWLQSGWAQIDGPSDRGDLDLQDCEYVLVHYRQAGAGMDVYCLGRVFGKPVYIRISFPSLDGEPHAVADLDPMSISGALNVFGRAFDTTPIAKALGLPAFLS